MKRRALAVAVRAARSGKRAIRGAMDSMTLPKALERTISELAGVEVTPDASRHVLLTSSGVHNIGDQAMLESFIANVPGPIDVIKISSSTYVIPSDARERVREVTLDSLVYGRGRAQQIDLQAFRTLLAQARSFSVIGADIMDGGYLLSAPALSWALSEGAAQAGIDSRVVGFSWGTDVPRLLVDAARRAAASGVRLFARDPDSAQRLQAAGIRAEEVVDTVFALEGEDPSTPEHEEISRIRAAGRRVLIINASGLIASRVDLNPDYLEIARFARDRGMHIVLLPHVGKDSSAVSRLSELLNQEQIPHTRIDRLLRPKQVRAIARQAAAVFTGRMHLSILSLSAGVPAVVLSTQGKVSGLMTRIGRPEWCIEPEPGMAKAAVAAFERVLNGEDPGLRQMIPELTAAGRRSFDGLA
ncbi:hypothetical protein ASD19_06940 [Microbacterium sp. Root53]|uniref:polysaccharide pyruvyl transferase family protein n=1 Tax=Microbacterium sp. Root53 TaxID=1736553 RepID=UPI000715F4E0|nr:polysaccharide pyruvyl transferase family protein [Microbacterium sp. Root53]KQY98567.1 hypothetical protein ASD19_06940 [Microbacterium sp. Root53]